MATLPDQIKATVIELIRQLNANDLPISQAYIFGSYAKGLQTRWSDIDVALISDRFEGDFFNDRSKVIPYVVNIETDIEAHPFRPEDFGAGNPFVEEILRTGVRIA